MFYNVPELFLLYLLLYLESSLIAVYWSKKIYRWMSTKNLWHAKS